MFKEMRRKDRRLKNLETIEILKKCMYGVLLTTGGNGYPYGAPVSYVYLNGAVYVHGAIEGV
ncbi:pyridoxamine 5'-phosphate oxidase family protein [Megasphaera sueciensis]|jgi:nitroimidazol reductase NimA-like FMN-containing flavoprotein (pyridoxamine 5'-phosphate oxidase superfamily)|uniref:pyridoxamine 5'-phosphate oxidase family protein n=1 Tax=Megasphaera sueciensis TaxID=349094 RepID=UPI003CFE9876